MGITVEVTNRQLYESKVELVDFEGLTAESEELFNGLLKIYLKQSGVAPFYGLIEADDFKNEYGFILKPMKNEKYTA